MLWHGSTRLRGFLRRTAGLLVLVAVVVVAYLWWTRRLPVAETLIYEGVTYGCDRLDADAEGSGLMHWVRVDLAAAGIELYVTPLDQVALQAGWQFRSRRTGTVVQQENLAVGINATLFTSKSALLPLPGDLARAVETTVADHKVSHVDEHTYLVWFDDQLSPRIESSKPPSDEVLRKARWAIGGQGVGLVDGKVWSGAQATPLDARTAVGIDPQHQLLFLAVFERASPRRALAELAARGAVKGLLLDGGDSTSMALGREARHVAPGNLLQGWRTPATHFGVRAKALNPR